jgi:hypothetical protein
LLLIAARNGSSPLAAQTSTVVPMDARAWAILYSPGMPPHPTPQIGGGWYFEFPTDPNSVHYVLAAVNVAASSDVDATISVITTGTPVFLYNLLSRDFRIKVAAWAHRNLPAKNSLTAADAKIVEERFQARLSAIDEEGPIPFGTPDGQGPEQAAHAVAQPSRESVSGPDASPSHKASTRVKSQSRSATIRALGKPVRFRDNDHRKFVLRQPCLVCGRVPSDPHHLTFTQPRAIGRRVSDEFIVPVCRVHHRELHRSGDEAAWWRKLKIDPLPVAFRLWQQTRADGELASSAEGVTGRPTRAG